MDDVLLVFNAGSTSLKFAAYGVDAARTLSPLLSGGIDAMQVSPRFAAADAQGRALGEREWPAGHPIDHDEALRFAVMWLQGHLSGAGILAVG
ncbi:MAG: acetate kinase, partial [Burkholderiaceae bacterium]